jgi:hypothetical protein
MLDRIRNALRHRIEEATLPPLRPNELRAEFVRAERVQREARQRRNPTSSSDDRAGRNARPADPVTPPSPSALQTLHPIEVLSARAGPRQAWLLKEILGPPVALRDFGQSRDRS